MGGKVRQADTVEYHAVPGPEVMHAVLPMYFRGGIVRVGDVLETGDGAAIAVVGLNGSRARDRACVLARDSRWKVGARGGASRA